MKSGELVYDSDGTTILYEEKQISDNVPLEVILNELGKEDTILTIKVTAEDGVTQKEYQVVIKRPYATIRGYIKYDEIEETEKNEDDEYIVLNKVTNLSFYKSGQVMWDELRDYDEENYENPLKFSDLDSVEKEMFTTSLEDGTYEVKIIPGTYDFQMERLGFLNYIIKNIVIEKDQVLDLKETRLIAGDVDRDGIVRLEDVQDVSMHVDLEPNSDGYLPQYNLIQHPDAIGLESVVWTAKNVDEEFVLIEFKDKERGE